MATKQPFTKDGADAKIRELYALKDVDLQTQTKLIHTDFKAWVAANFALDDVQASYLKGIDDRLIITAGPGMETCMNNRLRVNFIFPLQPIPTDGAKYIVIKPAPLPSYDPKHGFKIEGDLTIEIGGR